MINKQIKVDSYMYILLFIKLASFTNRLAGGFDGTSNVLAGKYRYLIAYVQSS